MAGKKVEGDVAVVNMVVVTGEGSVTMSGLMVEDSVVEAAKLSRNRRKKRI